MKTNEHAKSFCHSKMLEYHLSLFINFLYQLLFLLKTVTHPPTSQLGLSFVCARVCACASVAGLAPPPGPHTHLSFLPSVLGRWGQQNPSLPCSESCRLLLQVLYSEASFALVCLKSSRRQMETDITKHSCTGSAEGSASELVLLLSPALPSTHDLVPSRHSVTRSP